MKRSMLSLWMVAACVATSFAQEGEFTVVAYDKSCMSKYEYKADEKFLLDDEYINYHLRVDAERTIIFKVRKGDSAGDVKGNARLINCSNAQSIITKSFAEQVSSRYVTLLVADPTRADGTFHYVDQVIFMVDNENGLAYFNYPDMSFTYDYHYDYFPSEELYTMDATDPYERFGVRTFFHHRDEELEHPRHTLIKVFREVCGSRDFALITSIAPEPVHPLKSHKDPGTGKQIWRSCLHPVLMEFIHGVGLVREYYEEDGVRYYSRLTAIDGVPFDTYIQVRTPSEHIDPPAYAVNQPFSVVSTSFLDNSNKGSAPLAKIGLEQLKKPVSYEQEGMHTVTTGDTLYNLSKRYHTTVQRLRELNNLDSDLIKIGQQLTIF